MQKLINSGKSAMDKIMEGVNLVANPVKSTISPMGRMVIISESFVADYGVINLPITVSKDGYRISKSIFSADPEVQVGVRFIQEAADKQMLDAGDGTSTVCLLTQAILEGGLKLIEEGAKSIDVINGINLGVDYVVDELKKMATPINGDVDKIRQVATVTSNNDAFIGNLIAGAFEKIGVDGVINIEENKGRETTIKISEGIKFSKGWVSPYFVTNKAKSEAVLENPYILIYDRPIVQLQPLLPIMEQIAKSCNATQVKRPLMIFCDDVDGEALATLTYNTQQGGFQACVVSMAFLGDKKRDFMEDIAAATGGLFINELKGTKLENVKIEQLGQAKKIIVGKDETVIIDGLKDESIFNKLVDSLKVLEAESEEGEDKDLLKKRIARLKGSVAILSVGATTEVEMKEKKDRIDDAVRSTRSAIEEGFICGGGTAFIKVQKPILIYNPSNTTYDGSSLVFDCLQKSLEQICENAGQDFKTILTQVEDNGLNYGYNAKTDKIEDLVLAGIIEPVKSNRCALQNAASVVCAILSSQFMITDTL